jgi:hypothetical protein
MFIGRTAQHGSTLARAIGEQALAFSQKVPHPIDQGRSVRIE